jgi:hypothetical protein
MVKKKEQKKRRKERKFDQSYHIFFLFAVVTQTPIILPPIFQSHFLCNNNHIKQQLQQHKNIATKVVFGL